MSDTERAAGDDSVQLRNNLRRPIAFRAAGRTHRLSPGGDMEVPASWLGSSELQRLCGGGQLSAVAPATAADEAEADDEAGQDEEPDMGDAAPARSTGRKTARNRRTPRAKE